MAVREGTPVYDARDKRVGVVKQVLADHQAAILEGILIHTLPLPGRHVVADVDQISGLHEDGVVLSVEGRIAALPSCWPPRWTSRRSTASALPRPA